MTAFIRGIFRSQPDANARDAQTSSQQNEQQNVQRKSVQNVTPAPQQKAEAFFLSPDDAKTYGDINFMRSAKSIRRTFPKGKTGSDNEFVQSVSSLEKQNGQAFIASNSTEAEAAQNTEAAERRRSDTSMDMFRNMARDMRKR